MTAFLFSCEHATCAIPEAHRELFRGSEDLVASPDGWDPGALNLAQGFSMKFRTPLVHGDVTRLLIDLDENGDARWSPISLKLPETTRAKLVERTERLYRTLLNDRIAEDLQRHASVLHLMVHTAPAGGILLTTPADSHPAADFAERWLRRIRASGLDARHQRAARLSGLAESLLETHPPGRYAPIRLEASQSFFLSGTPWKWETLKKFLIGSMHETAADPTLNSSPMPPATD